MSDLNIEWLGRVRYEDGLALQKQAVEQRRVGQTCDRLLLLEHPPVVTLGSGTHNENLLVSESELRSRGIDLQRANRGGDVTYHAPGQLVGYLVMDLAARQARDVHRFLRDLEGALIAALGSLGLAARRIDGMTGVYVDPGPDDVGPIRKIASIGIGVRHWITYHGFALNVSVDLDGFAVIVPCGLKDVQMTSVARELERAELRSVSDQDVRALVAGAFEAKFADEAAAS